MVHRASQPRHAHVLQSGMHGPGGAAQDEEVPYCGAGNAPARACTGQSFVRLTSFFDSNNDCVGAHYAAAPDISCPEIHFVNALAPVFACGPLTPDFL